MQAPDASDGPVLRFPLKSFFVAIPLEGEAKERFLQLRSALEPYRDFLSLQKPETPHLTLRFWREVMEIEHGQIVRECVKVAQRSSSFVLPVDGADTFGSRGEDRVLFLSVAFSPELATLKKLCPWPNEQPFHPHITLARVTRPQTFTVHRKKILKTLGTPSFAMDVDRLRAYAAVEGVHQTPLRDFRLAQA